MKPKSISVLQQLFNAYPNAVKKCDIDNDPTVSKAISRLLLNDPPLIRVTGVEKPPKIKGQTTLEPAYKLTAYGMEMIRTLNQEIGR
jgi:hypothetical protein